MNLFASDIFLHALIAGTVAALVAAPVGYFLVLRAQAFAGEALKDVAFAGAAGAALFGFNVIVGMLGLSLLAAMTLGVLSERIRGRDIEAGMVLSLALGLGVMFLNLWARSSASHANSAINLLFGSILSIERSDLPVTCVGGVLVLSTLAAIFRPLLFASVDPTTAEARGVPIRGLSLAFMILLAITVALSVIIVGVLLVGALLIAPAASALNLTRSSRHAVAAAMLIALGATWTGLALAFLPGTNQLPVGFNISALVSITYFVSWLVRHLGEPTRRAAPIHPSREVGAAGTSTNLCL